MTHARHRISAIRHDPQAGMHYGDIDVDPNAGGYHIATISWYPTEDMTLHDVRGGLGATYTVDGIAGAGTGCTSATLRIDQNIHYTYAESHSDESIQIGAAARVYDGNSDFSWEFNVEDWEASEIVRDGYLSTPAKRGVLYFRNWDWGQVPIDQVPTGSCGGITLGDNIISATLELTVLDYEGHANQSGDPSQHDDGSGGQPRPPQELLYQDQRINVRRIARGSSAPGASGNITAGSMVSGVTGLSWWNASVRAGTTIDGYWGYSGGQSSSANPQPTSDLDTTYSASFIQPAFMHPGDKIQVDVTDLVQDSISSRTGDLPLMLHSVNDTDGSTTAYGHPLNDGSYNYIYTNWRNMTRYFSKDASDPAKRPRIDILYRRFESN